MKMKLFKIKRWHYQQFVKVGLNLAEKINKDSWVLFSKTTLKFDDYSWNICVWSYKINKLFEKQKTPGIGEISVEVLESLATYILNHCLKKSLFSPCSNF